MTDKLTGEKPPVEEEKVKREEAEEKEGEEGGSLEVERDENDLLHLTDENFSSFINSKPGVQFVKFYAPWSVTVPLLASLPLTPLPLQVWPLQATSPQLGQAGPPLPGRPDG